MPSHVSEEGPWEMQELDAVLVAGCPGWPFLKHCLDFSREPVPAPPALVQKASDTICLLETSGFGEGSAL